MRLFTLRPRCVGSCMHTRLIAKTTIGKQNDLKIMNRKSQNKSHYLLSNDPDRICNSHHSHHNHYFVNKIIILNSRKALIMNSENTKNAQVYVIGLASIGGKKKKKSG